MSTCLGVLLSLSTSLAGELPSAAILAIGAKRHRDAPASEYSFMRSSSSRQGRCGNADTASQQHETTKKYYRQLDPLRPERRRPLPAPMFSAAAIRALACAQFPFKAAVFTARGALFFAVWEH